MSVVFHYIKEKILMPAPRKECLQSSPPVDTDLLDANLGSLYVGQKLKVLSSYHSTRDPAPLFARAVVWEATSWMNPRTEELRRDRGALRNLLKPLGVVGRVVARLIYTLVVPTLAGAASILYHPAKGFYQLCRAGLYDIKSRNDDKEMKKIAEEALRLAGLHVLAAMNDIGLMVGQCTILGAVVCAFKDFESNYMKTMVDFAFSDKEICYKYQVLNEIRLRSTRFWFLKD